MSTIEIKADLDSAEHFFEYRGSELREPLGRLYGNLMKQAAELSREAGSSSTTPLPTLAGLIKPGVENDARQKIRGVLSAAFEALLWAQECRRTPERSWKLTMGRLKWLYRDLDPQ